MKCTLVDNNGEEIPADHLKMLGRTTNTLHDEHSAHATLWNELMVVKEAYEFYTSKEGEVDREKVMWYCVSENIFLLFVNFH